MLACLLSNLALVLILSTTCVQKSMQVFTDRVGSPHQTVTRVSNEWFIVCSLPTILGVIAAIIITLIVLCIVCCCCCPFCLLHKRRNRGTVHNRKFSQDLLHDSACYVFLHIYCSGNSDYLLICAFLYKLSGIDHVKNVQLLVYHCYCVYDSFILTKVVGSVSKNLCPFLT